MMKRWIRSAALCVLAGVLASCATTGGAREGARSHAVDPSAAAAGLPKTAQGVSAPAAQMAPRPVTILIGIDGFRWDYLDRGVTPNLSKMAGEGARALRMRPGFPSVTFPNFYTLATGNRPDHNGIVANTMEDPSLPGRTFSMGNRAEATDPVWWDEAEPIWVTAKRQGHRTATMFWPGSESRIRGGRPDYWLPFEQSVPSMARTNILLGWFSVPEAERPDFATLYFDVVDTAGHRGGPDSDLVKAALADVDAAVGALVQGLAARGLTANIMIVADHGMTAVSAERVVFLDDLVDVSAIRMVFGGAFAGIETVGPGAEKAQAALLTAHPHMQCWRKNEIPARLDYGTHRRVASIVCLAETGWLVNTKAKFNPAYAAGGAHGYDNAAPDMAGVFIAHGPAFASGVTLQTIDNVDVYPRLAALLGVRPEKNQGSLAATEAAMKR